MPPSVEDRLRTHMNEYIVQREERLNSEISNNVTSIFVWGVLCGAVLSYVSLIPMLVGFAIGISIGYGHSETVERLIQYSSLLIIRGREYLLGARDKKA